jgi:hypothetical protein
VIEGGEAIVAEGEAVSVQAGTALVKVEEMHTADVEAREAATEISMEGTIHSNTSLPSLVMIPHLSM